MDIYLLTKGESAIPHNAIEYVSLTDYGVSKYRHTARRLAEEYGLVPDRVADRKDYWGRKKDDTGYLEARVLRYELAESEA